MSPSTDTSVGAGVSRLVLWPSVFSGASSAYPPAVRQPSHHVDQRLRSLPAAALVSPLCSSSISSALLAVDNLFHHPASYWLGSAHNLSTPPRHSLHPTSRGVAHEGTRRDSSVYVPPATSSTPLAGVTQAEYCRRARSCFTVP